MDSDKYNS